jgi:hypothetical protein
MMLQSPVLPAGFAGPILWLEPTPMQWGHHLSTNEVGYLYVQLLEEYTERK